MATPNKPSLTFSPIALETMKMCFIVNDWAHRSPEKQFWKSINTFEHSNDYVITLREKIHLFENLMVNYFKKKLEYIASSLVEIEVALPLKT